jgi:hypothetical protein
VGDKCSIEVVDVLEKPEVARRDQIVAVPTLLKMSPEPKRVLIGDFTRVEQVLKGLDIDRHYNSAITEIGEFGRGWEMIVPEIRHQVVEGETFPVLTDSWRR